MREQASNELKVRQVVHFYLVRETLQVCPRESQWLSHSKSAVLEAMAVLLLPLPTVFWQALVPCESRTFTIWQPSQCCISIKNILCLCINSHLFSRSILVLKYPRVSMPTLKILQTCSSGSDGTFRDFREIKGYHHLGSGKDF